MPFNKLLLIPKELGAYNLVVKTHVVSLIHYNNRKNRNKFKTQWKLNRQTKNILRELLKGVNNWKLILEAKRMNILF
jgi:hypothetical protein